MSRIDELVERLCPEGVEYRALGEVVNIVGGRDYKHLGEGGVPVYGSGGIMTYVDTPMAKGPTVLLPRKGSISNVFYVDEPFWIVDTVFYTEINTDCLHPRFFYHVMLNEHIEKLNTSNAARPALTRKVLAKIRIPVPPMEVQEEVVRVLDSFAELEAELEAELAARRRQYAYYRDQLLDFTEREDVPWLTLGEVFETRNGYTPSKRKSEYWQDGTVPWFRMEDIRENGHVLDSALQQVNQSALKQGGVFPANSLIVATSATIGEHALITVDFLCNQRFTCLMLKDEYEEHFDVKFLFYYCFVLDEWCKANTHNSSFASVDMQGFAKFPIPLPPLAEQERIVAILDRFDALTTSLTEGLPAEIEARRAQYAHYRDRLLAFPERTCA